jgi:ribosomal protein L3 glutamine methyltransferase
MDRPDALSTTDSLLTIRDWLRFGVSAFNEANLVFGHGTDNALDEAAFLILSALHLPIDTLDPWLDCRLTQPERVRVRDLIAARISTRKPAAYLTQTAYIQGRKFYVDERVIVPRSFIGELICQDSLAAVVSDADAITSVLDLCTGSGCLAILAAEAFPNAAIDASDISSDALAVARRNVDDYDLAARVQLIQSDLFSTLPTRRYDLIISNPPYVTEASVAKFSPEYRAEPQLAHLGGADGLDLVRVILKHAHNYLVPNGILVVEIGDGRDALEAAYPSLPFFWLDTETSEGEVFALTADDLATN